MHFLVFVNLPTPQVTEHSDELHSLHTGTLIYKIIYHYVSSSAHQTPNFLNPEFQFPQFKVLQRVFFFLI